MAVSAAPPPPPSSPDSLDIEQHDQLVAYLRAAGRIGADETPAVRTLAGGVSNRTVWVKRPSGEAWVLKQALAKLRVNVDWFSDPSRVHREAMGLRWLAELAPPGTTTPLVFEDEEHHLLAMRAVPEPHENWKTMLLRGEVATDHVQQFSSLLRSIFDNSRSRVPRLSEVFGDRSFFESLRLEPYYEYTAQRVPEAAAFLRELIADTRATARALVHGDYSPKNILVHRGRLILLDHEVIHWGDPAFDVGFALTHFLSKANHLPAFRATFIRAAAVFTEGLLPDMCRNGDRHALACMLARVAGRSPLEYLTDEERARQRRAVLKLLSNYKPMNVPELVERFARELDED